MKFPLLSIAACSIITAFSACNNASKNNDTEQKDSTSHQTSVIDKKPAMPPADDSLFTKDGSDLNCRVVTHGTGNISPAIGSVALMHLIIKIGDSILLNTDKQNNNMPFPQAIAAPVMKGDLMAGITKMKVGDSMIFRMSADTFFARSHQPRMPFAKPGDNIEFQIKLADVTTKEALNAKMEAERTKKDKAQNDIDDKKLQAYFKAHNIKNTKKTASGMYYVVTKQGSGAHPKDGQNATVNYTGQNLKGEKFDSNIDPAFHHVQPFDFTIGNGVIVGWSQAVPLMNKGMKATFYIPSSLAYGSQAKDAKIGANEVLIFDIELTDFK